MRPACGKLAALLSSCIILASCASIDQYASRAVVYNEQASQSKSSTILLNVIRAAYRQPLQFTDISTVTGVASSQGSLGASIPLKINGPALTSPSFMSLTPSLSASGGPNFSVGNLNTKEFYQGIQSPLEPQILVNYVNAGIPLKLLLMLYVSEIEVRDTVNNKKFTVRNSAVNDKSYQTFLSAIETLVRRGLWLEPVATSQAVGPKLTRREASNPILLAGLAESTAAASSAGGTSLSLKSDDDGKTFQLNVPGSKWRFCFVDKTFERDSKESEQNAERGVSITRLSPTRKGGIVFNAGFVYDKGSDQVLPIRIAETYMCGSKRKPGNTEGGQISFGTELRFTTRSFEGILMYLGDMTRAQLGLDSGETNYSGFENTFGSSLTSNSEHRNSIYLFKVGRGKQSGEIVANFAGSSYSVASDPSGSDASSTVIQILTDLWAIKSAAKNLPPPNVLSVAQ